LARDGPPLPTTLVSRRTGGRHRGRVLTGHLKLGIIPTLAPYLLPKVLPDLQARYPDLIVELRETQTKILVEELVGGTRKRS
jgi:LysR family hydrogen peroxide-inducible transcriptional activator